MAPVPPPPEALAGIAAKQMALVQVIESDSQFSRTPSNSILYWVWEFANRTVYMLSEIDGIRQPGYQFQYQGQIKITERGEKAAEYLYTDTFTRSVTLEQLVGGPPTMRAMTGMDGEVSPKIQGAVRAALDAYHSDRWN
ncbi:hypothetical protein GGI35DRAFT_437268 [Trichoderma velutinum]